MARILQIFTAIAFLLLVVAVGFWLFDPDYGLLFPARRYDQTAIELGARLYQNNSCQDCHGVHGKEPLIDAYPRLNKQSKEYLLSQLSAIKSGERNYGLNALMRPAVEKLSEDELRAIALYLSVQP